MAHTAHELLHFTAPTMIVIGDVPDDIDEPLRTLAVKGFASVEKNDRSGDITRPGEFNIPEFMAAPTLLLNHRFWQDFSGNMVSIGRVLSMTPAKLKKNDDASLWSVHAIKGGEFLTTMPKQKLPSLNKGDQGLFVTAEVTVPDVIEQIRRGEIGGMSWRGLTLVDWELDPKTMETRRVLKDIDLYEISLTHIPDQNQSTFVVGKNAENGDFEPVEGINLEDVQLWRVQLPKERFVTSKMAEEYLNYHKLAAKITHEDKDSWIAEQKPDQGFDLSKTVRIKMADAFMLMAPPVEAPSKEASQFSLVAELIDIAKSSIVPFQGDRSMSDTGTLETVTTPAVSDTDAQKVETQKAAVEAEEKKKKADMEEKEKKAKAAVEAGKTDKQKAADQQLAVLGESVGNVVANALKPTLEGIASGMTGLGDTLKEVVAKMASGATAPATDTKTDGSTETEKEEVAKSANFATVMDALNSMAEGLTQTQNQLVEVAKSAVALGESIPNGGETVRNEKVEVVKGADTGDDADPNACLDGIMPFGV